MVTSDTQFAAEFLVTTTRNNFKYVFCAEIVDRFFALKL
jgi:hypothetical protein